MTRTSYTSQLILGLSALVLAFGLATVAQATPIPVATYLFDNSLAAEQAGVAMLMAVNPTGANTFESATVFGQTRQVYRFDGNNVPATDHAGLELNISAILTSNDQYSVEMVFEFFDRNNDFRRIIDAWIQLASATEG